MILRIIILIVILFTKYSDTLWPSPYKIDLKDNDTFIIALGNEVKYVDDDDDNIEMIQPNDLSSQVELLHIDNNKYKSLHSHVQRYNLRAANLAKKKLYKNIKNNLITVKEVNVIEPIPYIADFRHNIERLNIESRRLRNINKTTNINNLLRRNNEYDDLKQKTLSTNLTTINNSNDKLNDMEIEENYNYDNFKDEYYQQLDNAKNNNITFNYTIENESEDSPKDALKKIIELKVPKNCTEEELTKFGLKAFQCLVYDYKHAKKPSDVKKILFRTWTVIKIWFYIYIFVAIPCWCQKGWCCCCCRCDFCFPQRRIRRAKKYLTLNPPGILIEQGKKGQQNLVKNYNPSILEIDAYEKLQSEIRNL